MADPPSRRLADAEGLGQAHKEMPLSDWRTNLAPRPRPWREIVDAADWLRHDRGVSKSLWDEACIAMGREEAAIVSATPAEQFTGGAVHGWEEKPFSKGSAGKRQPTGGAGWRG